MNDFPSGVPEPILTGETASQAELNARKAVVSRVRKRDVARDVVVIFVVRTIIPVMLVLTLTRNFANIGSAGLLIVSAFSHFLSTFIAFYGLGLLGRQPTRIKMRRLFYAAVGVELVTTAFILCEKRALSSWVIIFTSFSVCSTAIALGITYGIESFARKDS